jgi:Ca2+-binding EF-hand superfamily protein
MMNIPIMQRQIEALISLYGDGEGDVDYRRFAQDVSKPLGDDGTTETISTKTAYREYTEQREHTFAEIINDVRLKIERNRIRPFEFFKDFDKQRTGIISRTKFITGIELLNLSLPQKALGVLCDHYVLANAENRAMLPGTELLSYAEFLDDISVEEKENSPLGNGNSLAFSAALLTQNELAQENEEQLHNILERIRHRCQEQLRVNLAPKFKDFDRHNMGRITEPQFRNVLNILGIETTDEEYALLKEKYKTPLGEISYRPFLRYVE